MVVLPPARSMEPDTTTAPVASTMTYGYGAGIAAPLFVIVKFAVPSFAVHEPFTDRSGAGGGAAATQVDISTTVVNVLSFGEVRVKNCELPFTVTVVLCPGARLIVPESTTVPLSSTT